MIIGVVVHQGDISICLPKPNRHHHCFRYGVDELGLTPPVGTDFDRQGFYTADGKFLNRVDALKYAKEHNQLINPNAKYELFSEDLW